MRVRVVCNFKENRIATIRLLADQWSDLNELEPPTTLAAFMFLSSRLTDWSGFDGPDTRPSQAPYHGLEDVGSERNGGVGHAPADGPDKKSSRSHRRCRRPPHSGPGTAFAGPGQGFKYGAGISNSNDFPWKSCVESTSCRYVPNNQMYLRWKYNSSVRISDEKLSYSNVKARHGNSPRAKHVGSPTGRVSTMHQKTSLPPAAITNRSIPASSERLPPVASMYSLVKNGFISSPENFDSMLRNRGNLEALLEMDRNAMKFRSAKNRISFPEAGKNLSDILRNPIYYIFPFSEKTQINTREPHSREISKQELSNSAESHRDTSSEDKEESEIRDTRLSSSCQVHLLHANEENTGDKCTVSTSNVDTVSRDGKETRFDTSEKEPHSQKSSTNVSSPHVENKEIHEENEENSSLSTTKKYEEPAPIQPSTEHLIIGVDDDSTKDEEELNDLMKISGISLPFQLQTYYPPGLSGSSTTESKASPSDRLENSEEEYSNVAGEYSNGAKFKSLRRDKEKQRFEQLRLDIRRNRNANRLIRPRKLLRYRTNKISRQNGDFRSHSPSE